jgi:hypothetical protein
LDEDILTFGDKRVDGRIVNEKDPYSRRVETVDLGEGIFVALEQAFGLSIAKEANLLCRGLLNLKGEGAETAGEHTSGAREAAKRTP